MRASSLLYYGLGFSYMLLAAQIIYLAFRIDDLVANLGEIHYTIRPAILITIGLTLIGAGIMLLSDPSEYTLAKLLAASGLVITLSGFGMGIEFAARRYYLNHPNIIVIPVYVSRSVSEAAMLNTTMFCGLIMLFIAILPGATFVVTEYERMMSTAIILLNAAVPAIDAMSVMMLIPRNHVLAGISAVLLFVSILSLVLLDILRALQTIPME